MQIFWTMKECHGTPKSVVIHSVNSQSFRSDSKQIYSTNNWILTDNVNVDLESVQKRLAGPTKSQGATREYSDSFLT